MLNQILLEAKKATSNRNGLKQMTTELQGLLLQAEAKGLLTVTDHNHQYCIMQGAWSTPKDLITHCSHFEMYDDHIIMLKQGGRKMRAFKIAEA